MLRTAGTGVVGPLDLVVSAGEVVGLLGPNGAGKTTLLSMLATRLSTQSGELRLFGETVARSAGLMGLRAALRAVRRRIGYAPDHAVHLGRLTGRENAMLIARACGLEEDAAIDRAGPLFARFVLERDADRQAREYSFGMARKLLLIEAFQHQPGLVLLDEPTLGLDPTARETLRELIAECAAGGGAVVLASNDIAAAHASCDRIVLIHGGRVVTSGRPHELIARVPGGDRIDVRFEGTPPASLPEGLTVDHAEAGRLRLRSSVRPPPLAELCLALERSGAALRALSVRAPDLRDVFEVETGSDWGAEAEGQG